MKIKALPATKKFGEVLPDFQAEITVTRLSETEPNTIVTVGTYQYPFTGTNIPPAELGLDNLVITSTANNLSPVGTYPIKPILPANTNSVIYTSDVDATLTITKMPLRISALQTEALTYGKPITGIKFVYYLDETNLGSDAQKTLFRKALILKHQLPVNRDAFALD